MTEFGKSIELVSRATPVLLKTIYAINLAANTSTRMPTTIR